MLRLKEKYSNVSQDKDKLADENRLLRETLAQNGLPLPANVRFDDSGSSPSVADPSSVSGSSYAAGRQTAFTPPLTSLSTAPSVSSSHKPSYHQPMSGNQYGSTMQQSSSSRPDLEQAGIDFVLTYDNPSSKAYLSPPPQ